jgi:hypothetical protein
MPKFVCSYAHDIPCYADFVVEAQSGKAALRKLKKALRERKFESVEAEPWWENGPENERVFVQGLAKPHSTETTFEQLTSANLTKGKT